jgi:uncharacterized protein (TIGR03435 family)
VRLAIVSLLLLSPALHAQTADHGPVFETASIKMTEPKLGGGHVHEHDGPGLLRASMTLKSYIRVAYEVEPYQVTGGPEWMDASTYDILAKLENGALQNGGNAKQLHAALRNLLAERFQLKFHHETKDMPAYALTVAKSGLKLKPVSGGSGCGTNSNGNGVRVTYTATCIDIAEFASYLSRNAGRPVLDQTRIDGLYSFSLVWTPDDLKAAASPDSPALPSLFTVIQEQLGLRLDPRKAPVDIMVVDNAERPSEN